MRRSVAAIVLAFTVVLSPVGLVLASLALWRVRKAGPPYAGQNLAVGSIGCCLVAMSAAALAAMLSAPYWYLRAEESGRREAARARMTALFPACAAHASANGGAFPDRIGALPPVIVPGGKVFDPQRMRESGPAVAIAEGRSSSLPPDLVLMYEEDPARDGSRAVVTVAGTSRVLAAQDFDRLCREPQRRWEMSESEARGRLREVAAAQVRYREALDRMGKPPEYATSLAMFLEPEISPRPGAALRETIAADRPERACGGYWFRSVLTRGKAAEDPAAWYAVAAVPARYGDRARYTYLLTAGKLYFKDTAGRPVNGVPSDLAAEFWKPVEPDR